MFCRYRENGEDLDHYLYDYFLHFGGRWYLGVNHEAQKEEFHALKNLNDYTVTRAGVSNRLICTRQMARVKVQKMKVHTKRSMPIPVKTAFAGEKTCQVNSMNLQLVIESIS